MRTTMHDAIFLNLADSRVNEPSGRLRRSVFRLVCANGGEAFFAQDERAAVVYVAMGGPRSIANPV